MDNLTETKLTSEKIYSGCILDFYRDTVRLPGHRRPHLPGLQRPLL